MKSILNNGLTKTVQQIESNQTWILRIGKWILGIVATIAGGLVVAGIAWAAQHGNP